jgi:hypothetical protein
MSKTVVLAVAVAVLVALDIAAAVHQGQGTGTRRAAPGRQGRSATAPSSAVSALGPSPLAGAVPGDAVDLATQLSGTESAIRNTATPPGALVQLGQLEQLDYGRLTAHPDWDATVQALLPSDLREPAGLIVDAGRQLDSLDAGSRPSYRLPAWNIVAPAPAPVLIGDYQVASAATGIPWTFLAAINLVETRMGRISGDSSAGARGPMQFLPATWAMYGDGGDIESPGDAIAAAARLLHARGAPADMARALYHYNPSRRYARAVTDYARVIAGDPQAFLGLYQWQVFVTTPSGQLLLPVGYRHP